MKKLLTISILMICFSVYAQTVEDIYYIKSPSFIYKSYNKSVMSGTDIDLDSKVKKGELLPISNIIREKMISSYSYIAEVIYNKQIRYIGIGHFDKIYNYSNEEINIKNAYEHYFNINDKKKLIDEINYNKELQLLELNTKIRDYDYCQDIEVIKDKFENKTTYQTPLVFRKPFDNSYSSSLDIQKVGVIKVKENGKSIYYGSFIANGRTVVVDGRKTIILLDNGHKIIKNNEIDVEVNSNGNGYDYSSFFTLTSKDVELLSNHKITDYKLYIYEESVSDENQERLRTYVKCLIKK